MAAPTGSQQTYKLRFSATQAQPQYAKLFLASGGSLNAAAADGETDFSLTHSTSSVFHLLHRTSPTSVEIELPPALYTLDDGALLIDARAKLNVATQHESAAINGTVVSSRAGAGSAYLSTLLRDGGDGGHFMLPLIYGVLASHSATVGCSKIEVVDEAGEPCNITFYNDVESVEACGAAAEAVDAIAHASWELREKHLKFPPCPTLTKSVCKQPCGTNDNGYALMSEVIDQPFAFNKASLNGMLKHAVSVELGFDEKKIDAFLSSTAVPGMKAAGFFQTVATAASSIASYLTSYRVDGRTVLGVQGSVLVESESWLGASPRTPCTANDCDGSAMCITSLLKTAVDSTEDERAQLPFLRAARNAVHPHYTVGVSVVAATSAEASGGGGDGSHVAGHAVAVALPTSAFLDALHTAGAHHTIGGQRRGGSADLVRLARHEAVFNAAVCSELPPAEQKLIARGPEALRGSAALAALPSLGIEGTTPASALLFALDDHERKQAAVDAALDEKAFSSSGPTVGRGIKNLSVGGGSSADPHRFYQSFVELSLPACHPLYTDNKLRAMGEAASQFVLLPPSGRTEITEVGATPRQLAMKGFMATALATIDAPVGKLLDHAAEVSRADVIPPRAGPMMLTEEQSAGLRRSMAALEKLNETLSAQDEEGHCVSHVLSYSTIVSNPTAVEHFCSRVGACAVGGVVDCGMAPGLAQHPDGSEAGHFVIVNSVVKV